MTSQLQSIAMARYPLTGSRVSLSASTRIRGCIGKEENTGDCGHESPGQDYGQPHQTVVVIRQFPGDFVAGRGTTDTVFVVRQLQEKYRHGFNRPGEGF